MEPGVTDPGYDPLLTQGCGIQNNFVWIPIDN
jgi:hypothetical protein